MSAKAFSPSPSYVAEAGRVESDRESVLAIWRGNLGEETTLPHKFDWFYRQSPEGPPLLMLLRHLPSGALVGVGAVGPRRLLCEGRMIRAGVLADLAVSPQHRSLGPALGLQKALIARAAEHFEFVYGFPNPKALPVFLRAGFEVLGAMERHARVLRHADYLSRHMPRALSIPLSKALDAATALRPFIRDFGAPKLVTHWVEGADARMEALFADSDKDNAWLAVRDASFLHWRFDGMPGARIRYLLVEEAPSGTLGAWFACASDGGQLKILDFWSKQGAAGVSSAYIAALLRAAWRKGCSSVSVEYAGRRELFSAWREAGFVLRGQRPLLGLWMGSSPAPATSLLMTAADEDE